MKYLIGCAFLLTVSLSLLAESNESIDEAIIADLDFFQSIELLEDQELLDQMESMDATEDDDEN